MFYFHKVACVQYLGEVDIFAHKSRKIIPIYNSAKIIKIDRYFPKLWSEMYCHFFMVHSVHMRQSIEAVFCHGWTEVGLYVFDGAENAFAGGCGDRKTAQNAQQNDDARKCGYETLNLSKGQIFFLHRERGNRDPCPPEIHHWPQHKNNKRIAW